MEPAESEVVVKKFLFAIATIIPAPLLAGGDYYEEGGCDGVGVFIAMGIIILGLFLAFVGMGTENPRK